MARRLSVLCFKKVEGSWEKRQERMPKGQPSFKKGHLIFPKTSDESTLNIANSVSKLFGVIDLKLARANQLMLIG